MDKNMRHHCSVPPSEHPKTPYPTVWTNHHVIIMLGILKEKLVGHKFNNDTAVKTFVHKWLMTYPIQFFNNEMKKLPIRW